MKLVIRLVTTIALAAGVLLAQQNLVGTWQGTLKDGPNNLRIVYKIAMSDDRLTATMYSIDQESPGIPAIVTRDRTAVKIVIPGLGSYEGKLNLEGNSIAGAWTQGAPLTLNLVRATTETAWGIPEPPSPPFTTAVADTNPSFEVAAIKPSRPDEHFAIQMDRSAILNTKSTSLVDLIKFAFNVYPQRIKGLPDWAVIDKFTITAKPAAEGIPNAAQLKAMMRKLLAERFQLTFHHEIRELPVFALTIVRAGHKMQKSESGSSLPDFGGDEGAGFDTRTREQFALTEDQLLLGILQGFNVRNTTMAEFASILMPNLLDRPVLDRTGLGDDRWNLTFKFTPDAAQLASLSAPSDLGPRPGDPAGQDLFKALQQQVGLKLESTKAPAEVMVIDRIERPSEN